MGEDWGQHQEGKTESALSSAGIFMCLGSAINRGLLVGHVGVVSAVYQHRVSTELNESERVFGPSSAIHPLI